MKNILLNLLLNNTSFISQLKMKEDYILKHALTDYHIYKIKSLKTGTRRK